MKKLKRRYNTCSFGCGKPGIYTFKTGNYCCSKYASQCLEQKKKIRESTLKNYNENPRLKINSGQFKKGLTPHNKKIFIFDGKLRRKYSSLLCACGCGEQVSVHKGRARKFISGHNENGGSGWNKGLTKETCKSLAAQAIKM